LNEPDPSNNLKYLKKKSVKAMGKVTIQRSNGANPKRILEGAAFSGLRNGSAREISAKQLMLVKSVLKMSHPDLLAFGFTEQQVIALTEIATRVMRDFQTRRLKYRPTGLNARIISGNPGTGR